MSWPFIIILAITALFYAAFPGIGGLVARGQWRVFRRSLITASGYPTASPPAVGREHRAFVGCFRFFGTLEAIQGEDRIWITNGRFSVAVYLRNVRVYLVPEEAPSLRPQAEPSSAHFLRSAPWNAIFSLPEGTPVFVAGALFSEEGRGVFRAYGRTRLLVVIHECPPESLLARAISGGRHRNELVNPLTVPSLAIGALSLMIIALSLLGSPEYRLAALLALSLALAPLTPFLPPGFLLYFAYRSVWKRGRRLRVQRDRIRSPLRYFESMEEVSPARAGAAGAERAGGASADPGSRVATSAGGRLGTARDGAPAIRHTLLPDQEPYVMIRGSLAVDGSGAEPRPGSRAILCGGQRIEIPEGTEQADVSLPWMFRWLVRKREWVVFSGCRRDEDGVTLRRAQDPMAEQLIVPGDPREISGASERAARGFQALAGFLLIVDVAVNFPLLVLLLTRLIR